MGHVMLWCTQIKKRLTINSAINYAEAYKEARGKMDSEAYAEMLLQLTRVYRNYTQVSQLMNVTGVARDA